MWSYLKKNLGIFMLGLLAILWFSISLNSFVDARVPEYDRDFTSYLDGYVKNPEDDQVRADQNFRKNIKNLFYPSEEGDWKNSIYKVRRGITLWVMIIFIVWAWASLLLNKKPEESKKHLTSLLYILLWWVFHIIIYFSI